MDSVTALLDVERGRADDYLSGRFTIVVAGIATCYDRLIELCDILSKQLDSIDHQLALPDASCQAQLTELLEATRLKLVKVGRLLVAEHHSLAATTQEIVLLR